MIFVTDKKRNQTGVGQKFATKQKLDSLNGLCIEKTVNFKSLLPPRPHISMLRKTPLPSC